MIVERVERDGYTDISIYNAGDLPWNAYRVTCMDIGYERETDKRAPPTVHISLLTTTNPTVENVRRLVAEYTYVADIAEALQAEKRAAYAEKYGAHVHASTSTTAE